MENNIERLKKYGELIKNNEKLSLEDATRLYAQYVFSGDKNIRTRIINGTLYVIYDFIKKYNFVLLETGEFDIDDIISSCNEIWITFIDEGRLLNIKNYYQLFTIHFFTKLNDLLITDKYKISENTCVDSNSFADVAYAFFMKNENGDVLNYNAFYEYLKSIIEKDFNKVKNSNFKIMQLYCLLNRIYDLYEKNEKKVSPFTNRMLEMMKYLLINVCSYNGDSLMQQVTDGSVDKVIDDVFSEKVSDIIANIEILNKREKSFWSDYCGLGEHEQKNIETISKYYNLSQQRISKIKVDSIKKLRLSKEMKELNNSL